MKDDKAKFFAQYYLQEVAVLEWRQGHNPEPIVEMLFQEDIDHLLLTSLDQITDEHAIEFLRLLGFSIDDHPDMSLPVAKMEVNKLIYDDESVWDWYNSISAVDFLRSKGYALPWLNYSVEKQIENGWIKLNKAK